MKCQVQIHFEADDLMAADAIRLAILSTLRENGVSATSGTVEEAPSTVVVHTDGGCDRNRNGIGAWAYTVHHVDGTYTEQAGYEWDTTNNRMELMAVINALSELEIGPQVTVVSDSEYVVKGTTVWSRNWVRNGWKTASGQPVINRDLWEPLIKLYQVHNVKFELVRGHTGNTFNERCDQLCTEAMTFAQKQMLQSAPSLDPSNAPL